MSSHDVVILFSPAEHSHLAPYLAAIHAACITHDQTVATFLPPLSKEKMLAWWQDRISEVSNGTRLIFILVRHNDRKDSVNGDVLSSPRGSDVMGVSMLSMPFSETGSFRASVEKFFVHPSWRGRGGGRKLMEVLEEEALSRGKTMITLDTVTDSPAEGIYPKLGYIEVGKIPKYGLGPTGQLVGGTFFYKQL